MNKADIRLVNEMVSNVPDTSLVSDGYHTFGELYEHRIALFIALCHMAPRLAWKSHTQSDGTVLDGWFIAGMRKKPGDQISYHLPASYWDKLGVPELEKAPEWDGHTSSDVVQRLLNWRLGW
jgi:hypothetical protein